MCPRCRVRRPLMDWKTKPEMPVYQSQTVPVYECNCTHVFALRSNPVELA